MEDWEILSAKKRAFFNGLKKDFPGLVDSAIDVSCGVGWHNLIYKLCADIYKIAPNVRVGQVKEKFGGLRFYIDSYGTQENEVISIKSKIDALIRQAEKDSFRTCEMCGNRSTAESRGEGWIKTLCDKCEENRNAS